MVKCKCCSNDTTKRKVVKRKPLIDITDQILPHKDVKKEFLCVNTIKTLHPVGKIKNSFSGKMQKIYNWFEETCDNHIIILQVEKK